MMTGINPFGKLDFDLNNDPALEFGVSHGLTLGGSRRSLADFTEGVASHSSIINRIPGLRTLQGEMQHFLFDRYIPGLKARAYKSLFDRYQKAYKDISPVEAAQFAAAHANELFGGLNYGQMGRSMATQDFLRATTLAPDWLESEVRSLYRALDPRRGALMRQDIMRMAAIMFGASRVLNYLTSGQPHLEAPFGVVVPGQQKGEADKVYTLRTLPTDMMHALTSPRDFIAGRVNPLSVRPAVEFLTGRDRQGRKVEFPQEVGDFFSAFTPITATNIANKLQDVGNLSGAEVAARTLGASTYQYKTEAEKLALQFASDRMPSGPLSGEQLAAHRRKLRAEQMIRAGEEPDLMQFSARERREIRKNAELSALQAHFQRLPMESALAVWDTATPQERATLVPEFLKKKNSFMRVHNTDTLPEKQSNRTYQRLLTMFAEGAPEFSSSSTTPPLTPLPRGSSPFDPAFR